MSRTALVTGAAGFLGLHLCRALAAKGDRVHAVLRPGRDYWRLAGLPRSVAIHRVDLADFPTLRRTVARVAPDVVYHAAIHPAGSGSPWRVRVADDILGTTHLLDAAEEIGVERLVCVDSSLVLQTGPAALDESAPLAPTCSRGASRGATTLILRQRRREGLPLTLVRPFHVYGPWEPPGRLTGRALLYALEGLPLSLTDAPTHLDPVHAADVAAACLRVAAAPPLAAPRVAAGDLDEVHVGRGRGYTAPEIAAAAESVVGRPLSVIPGGYPPGSSDGVHRVSDPSRAERRFGFTADIDLEAGLADTLAWIRSEAASGWRRASLGNAPSER